MITEEGLQTKEATITDGRSIVKLSYQSLRTFSVSYAWMMAVQKCLNVLTIYIHLMDLLTQSSGIQKTIRDHVFIATLLKAIRI